MEHSTLECGAPRPLSRAQPARAGARWPGAGCRGDASGNRPPPLDASARPRPEVLRIDWAPCAASGGTRAPARADADGRPFSSRCCFLRPAAPSADLPWRVARSREPPAGPQTASFRRAAAVARRAVAPRLRERDRAERFSGDGDRAPRTATSCTARSPLSWAIKRPHVVQRRMLPGVPSGHPPSAKKACTSMRTDTMTPPRRACPAAPLSPLLAHVEQLPAAATAA